MFSAKYKCSDCSHVFERVTERDPRKGGRAPGCPQCKKNKHPTIKSVSKSNVMHTQQQLDKNTQEIIDTKKFPSMGKSNFTKAMDATADIVMQDYNMTDLQDNLRVGDSMAPKLRPELERQVDEVFKPQKPIMGQKNASSLNNALTAQINSGRYASQSGGADIVQKAQNSGYKVPTNEIFNYDNRGKPN